jgi:hypothetical protein
MAGALALVVTGTGPGLCRICSWVFLCVSANMKDTLLTTLSWPSWGEMPVKVSSKPHSSKNARDRSAESNARQYLLKASSSPHCLYARFLVGCSTSISSPTRTVPFSITLAQIPPRPFRA